MLGLIAFTAGIITYWVTEYLSHIRRLRSIPVRIHVNGTRGKSSTTRLIAATLRAGGLRTCAKVTGTLPMFVYPDGSEKIIPRPGTTDPRQHGMPNIIEYVRVVKAAHELGAEAFVSECMALQPELQWVTEHRMMKSTIGVITNVRRDHLDVMGPTLLDVALALSNTIPKNGVLITADEHFFPLFKRIADRRGTTAYLVSDEDVDDREMQGFSYIEHKPNVAIALKIAELLGIDRTAALNSMYQAVPDAGVLRIHRIHDFGKTLFFVSAYAANDPDSFKIIWQTIRSRFNRWIVHMNCRDDRVERSVQLGELLAAEMRDVDKVIVTGKLTKVFIDAAVKNGFKADRIVDMENCTVEEAYRSFFEHAADGSGIFGMGNMVDFGEKLTEYIRERISHAV